MAVEVHEGVCSDLPAVKKRQDKKSNGTDESI
jgi:hypothetical protein